MTATLTPVTEGVIRRLARTVLTVAVRGRRERGGPWGEAVLGEFDHTVGTWEAVRWAAGGLRATWQERRGRARDRPRYVRISTRVVGYGLTVLVASTLLHQFVIGSAYIPSGGMERTMLIHDRWLVDKVGHRVTGLRHGDIVAVRWPGFEADGVWAQRVIGLPGDTISCREGRVVRNGAALVEAYLPPYPEESFTECSPVTVPSDSVYLLGDHRAASNGSQVLGPVPADAVEGRFLVRWWPWDADRDRVG